MLSFFFLVLGFSLGWYIRNTRAGAFIHSWIGKDKAP